MSAINSVMPANLPTELILCILDHVDIETYVAARSACCSWRKAATMSSTIRNALTELPVPIPPRADSLTNEEWNAYFCQIACLNLLGHRTHIDRTSTRRALPEDCTPTTVLATSQDGQKMATLKGARATIFTRPNKHSPWEYSRASTLYPLWTSVYRALMDGGGAGNCMALNPRYAKHCIAISSQGDLLAVGLGKTLQIYSLSGNEDNGISSPAEYTLDQHDAIYAASPSTGYEETDGVIDSLEFADDDTLLRIAIHQDTTAFQPNRVRYMGNPSALQHHHHTQTLTPLQYWRENIRHIHLDSASMAVTLGAGEEKVVLRGLRLLPSSYKPTTTIPQPPLSQPPSSPTSSHYFTASLQSGPTSAYCIGHIAISSSPPTSQQVTITRLLPSRQHHHTTTSDPATESNKTPPSSKDATATAGFPRWNPLNLPTASSKSPLLSISPDNKLLAIYEPDPSLEEENRGRIYVYCIEECGSVYTSHTKTNASSAMNADQRQEKQQRSSICLPLEEESIIPPWSFLLDNVSMDVDELRVSKVVGDGNGDGGRYYEVMALAGRDVLEWRIY
ncbi:F-box protein [Aspergillus vadensis CBS 113365]|uniref:F-box domain protein n=1 Tax=Aspergillus vadensis (strain CBS 113365 / IMI 142717 / IBT 24658) TaxID=1448311 RepID=A0A319CIT6_ASPVC|nr:F-box domain protein [Aspergillus vadensis CBS 113365]PYH68182.1 F-box domain protein [Aspergillus vadensis CBS 113365]